MKIATRKIVIRIVTLYTLATFTVGLNIPYTYPLIRDNAVISFGYGENSAFLIATVLNRMRHWPYFINDFIIFSAATAGANGIYNASRTLHALASIPDAWPDWRPIQALRRRLERTSYGVPHGSVIMSWMFGLLGFLANNSNSQMVMSIYLTFSNYLTYNRPDSWPDGSLRCNFNVDCIRHYCRIFPLLLFMVSSKLHYSYCCSLQSR
jgi:amino acid transporter